MATPRLNAPQPPLTVGTAGHIDHGKTSLIDALTGKNTDRLPEERSRGMSIELGYAALDLPSGRRMSVVDVPGHERFVRTMVAGATGIDLFLLCVAADDGVMPQTREHVAVLRGLGVEAGVVAVTKADLADPEAAAEEVGELVPGVEAVAVSAPERRGLPELLAALDRAAARLPGRAGAGELRLHVDRSFTLKGIGTVVTGTLWSGSVVAGDKLVVLPHGLEARVRSVQVHDEPVDRADAGQRVALNLAGVSWREISRGDLIAAPGTRVSPTYRIDAAIELETAADPIERGTRVHIHHGTREAPARVAPLDGDELRPGERGYAQLRLESPLMPAEGDRLILRRIAPPDTIGGGTVIDPGPRRHGGDDDEIERLLAIEGGQTPVPDTGGTDSALQSRKQPIGRDSNEMPGSDPGQALDDLDRRLAELLIADGREPRADGDLADAVGVAPREVGVRLRRLVAAGQAVRVAGNLHYAPGPLSEVERAIVAICEREGSATIAGVRDELGTSRRYAQALLEHLDATKVTRRQGDAHVLRRRGAAALPRE